MWQKCFQSSHDTKRHLARWFSPSSPKKGKKKLQFSSGLSGATHRHESSHWLFNPVFWKVQSLLVRAAVLFQLLEKNMQNVFFFFFSKGPLWIGSGNAVLFAHHQSKSSGSQKNIKQMISEAKKKKKGGRCAWKPAGWVYLSPLKGGTHLLHVWF